MAQTDKGQKFIRIPGHTKVVDGEKVKVKPHVRSTPKTSDGKSK